MSKIVTLEPWEYEHAAAVGMARFVRNWSRQDASHYDRGAMQDDRTAQHAAAACELAVAKATNRYWHAHVWDHRDHHRYRHMPDVGFNIEVRRCRTRDAVAVRRSDGGNIVFACRTPEEEFRQIEVVGYVEANEVIPGIDAGQDWVYIPFDLLVPYGDLK